MRRLPFGRIWKESVRLPVSLDVVHRRGETLYMDTTKGDCYKAAYQAVEDFAVIVASGLSQESKLNLKDVALVHGRITPTTGPSAGKEIGHAWVEIADQVLEVSNGNQITFSRAFWQAEVAAKTVGRYTYEEAKALAKSSGHYGPWPENVRERSRLQTPN